jgi:hypothetical protein
MGPGNQGRWRPVPGLSGPQEIGDKNDHPTPSARGICCLYACRGLPRSTGAGAGLARSSDALHAAVVALLFHEVVDR